MNLNLTGEEYIIMDVIKLYLDTLIREMKRVWMPAVGIGVVTICSIVYGCSTANFGILEFFCNLFWRQSGHLRYILLEF